MPHDDAASRRTRGRHDVEPHVSGIVHGPRHPVQGRRGGRGGVPRACRLADRERHARSRAGGHDGRKPDPDPRRTPHASSNVCLDETRGRVPVIAGAGSNNTVEAMSNSPATPKRPAPNAVLVVTPYYNKPTQEGLFQPFQGDQRRHRHSRSLIYNIPGRSSVVDMSVETMKRLFELDKIVGVKDATADRRPRLPAAPRLWGPISSSFRARI